jgi:hypothetical protein
MRNAICTAIATIGVATAADGATLSVQSDKPVYRVGETITLKVLGDAQGEKSTGVYGCLVYSGSGSAQPSTQTQKAIGAVWSNGGTKHGTCPGDPYAQPPSQCATGGAGFSDAFSQITDGNNQAADGLPPTDALSGVTLTLVTTVPQTAELLPAVNPFSTVTLTATGPGQVNVGWCSDLEWFSTTPAQAGTTSFVIVP